MNPLKRTFSDYLGGQNSCVGIEHNRRSRWTLRGQEVNGLKILAPIQNQSGSGGKCVNFACRVTVESHLRAIGIQTSLSFEDLERKIRSFQNNSNLQKPKTEECLMIMRDQGVCAKDSKEIYRISGFQKFRPLVHGDVNEAVKSYLRKGPMIGVFPVDEDAYRTYGRKKFGIYRCSIDVKDRSEKLSEQLPKHAVCIVGSGVDSDAPFFEIQNSHGDKWHCHGFGELYALELVELYGITGATRV